MKHYFFEVCANGVESCIGDIALAREVLTGTRLHVIIRPRGGDFLYSPLEQRIMLKDIEMAQRLGADGVVFGSLTADGNVDIPLMERLMEAAQGMSVTFHRAFDVCRDPYTALEDIIRLGCDRLLTSGQQPTAEQGIPLLRKLQEQAAGRITLLAGCGVNEQNIARIARETGIHEFHFSARENVESGMGYRNEIHSPGHHGKARKKYPPGTLGGYLYGLKPEWTTIRARCASAARPARWYSPGIRTPPG